MEITLRVTESPQLSREQLSAFITRAESEGKKPEQLLAELIERETKMPDQPASTRASK